MIRELVIFTTGSDNALIRIKGKISPSDLDRVINEQQNWKSLRAIPMDVDVFKQRFLPFHPKLYRIAYALLDNKADAEDILQDAYCKLWNKRDELGDIQNPEAFSITLVKNLCLDFLRSPKASRRDNEEALETVLLTTDSSPEKELEEKEDIRHIQELIEQLPENQRQVIRLRGIEDCSYEDIEQITGLSSSNIRTLLSRARKLIREKLEKASCHG